MPSKDEMVTPSQLGIERGTVIKLPGGWKPHTVYVVLAAFSSHNVIHEALFYTGFLNDDGTPGSYNGFLDTDPETYRRYHHAYFIKMIRSVYTKREHYLSVDGKHLEGVGNCRPRRSMLRSTSITGRSWMDEIELPTQEELKAAHDEGACTAWCPYCYDAFCQEIYAERNYWRFIEDCAIAVVLIVFVLALYFHYH